MINWQLLVNPIKPMRFMLEVDSWMQSVSGIFSIYFATFCYFPHLLNSFSNFECTQSNFLTEETAALHWNVGVFPATSRENLGKILSEQLVSIKLTITFRDLKTAWNQFFDFFWSQVSPENFRSQLNKNLRNGWNSNWKWSWLQSVTNLFIHGFHKNMSVARRLIQTIFNHRRKKLWRAMKLMFHHTD